jgi:hypothetical protein
MDACIGGAAARTPAWAPDVVSQATCHIAACIAFVAFKKQLAVLFHEYY